MFKKYFPIFTILLGVALLAAFHYFARLPFLADDYNLLYHAGKNPFPLFTDWVGGGTAMLRPFSIASLALQTAMHGLSPFAFYFGNILFHAIATFFVYSFTKQVLSRYFDIHSENINIVLTAIYFFSVQGVTNVLWISGRTDLLCTMFGYAALHVFFTKPDNNHIAKPFVIFSLLTLALLSKETGLLFTGVLIIAALTLPEQTTKARVKYTIVALGSAAGYFILRFIAFGSSLPVNQEATRYFTPGFWAKTASVLFFPVDVIELIHAYRTSEWYFLIFVILFAACSALLIYGKVKLLSNRRHTISIAALSLLALLSVTLYYRSYPMLRLMYAHIALLLPVVGVLLYQLPKRYYKLGSNVIVILVLWGSAPEYLGVLKQAEDARRLQTHIPAIANDSSCTYIYFPYLQNVSHRYCDPAFALAVPYWQTGTLQTRDKNHLFFLPYESSALYRSSSQFSYEQIDSFTWRIQALGGLNGFSMKQNSPIATDWNASQTGGYIKHIDYSNLLPGLKPLAQTCTVTFNKAYFEERRVRFILQQGDTLISIDPLQRYKPKQTSRR